MEQDERLLHGSSFGAAATAYAEHRPDYAPAAVRWALEPASGLRVLNLGAGTGKLTRAVPGCRVAGRIVAAAPRARPGHRMRMAGHGLGCRSCPMVWWSRAARVSVGRSGTCGNTVPALRAAAARSA